MGRKIGRRLLLLLVKDFVLLSEDFFLPVEYLSHCEGDVEAHPQENEIAGQIHCAGWIKSDGHLFSPEGATSTISVWVGTAPVTSRELDT